MTLNSCVVNYYDIYDKGISEYHQFAKRNGYEIKDFRIPLGGEYYISSEHPFTLAIGLHNKKGISPHLIVQKIEEFIPSLNTGRAWVITPSDIYSKTEKVNISDYEIVDFRPPVKGNIFISSIGSIETCTTYTFKFYEPRWILRKK